MKPLRALKQLQPLQPIKALQKERQTPKETPLSEIELISYSVNICYYSMRILRNEITVQNREAKLNALMQEVIKTGTLLQRDDYYLHGTYTKENTKKFFKQVGLKPEHIKH
jgi:hypothetical protein